MAIFHHLSINRYFTIHYSLFTMSIPIAGLTKLDLIDYPGKISCVVFTQGCNFRCRFCHNPDLLCAAKHDLESNQKWIEYEQKFFDFLETRKGKLDAVVVTGGEPTLHKNLPHFLKRIKDLGFLVKLDSQGTNPAMLKQILSEKLVDYVAMDIKHIPEKYHLVVGRKVDLDKINESINMIKLLAPDYEFRTTVVPGLHTERDFEEIAQWLAQAKNYYLQEFRAEVVFDKTLPNEACGLKLDLEKIAETMQKWICKVEIRR